ncbi:MAG TPA: hypothetical protein VMY35_02780 [Phycisphaerae bacterium]|nr:hypothetical protein [Phycisphaerae bacterium]
MASRYAVGETYSTGWSLTSGGEAGAPKPVEGDLCIWDAHSAALMVLDEAPAAGILMVCDAPQATLGLGAFDISAALFDWNAPVIGSGNITVTGDGGDIYPTADFSNHTGWIIFAETVYTEINVPGLTAPPDVLLATAGKTATVDVFWKVRALSLANATQTLDVDQADQYVNAVGFQFAAGILDNPGTVNVGAGGLTQIDGTVLGGGTVNVAGAASITHADWSGFTGRLNLRGAGPHTLSDADGALALGAFTINNHGVLHMTNGGGVSGTPPTVNTLYRHNRPQLAGDWASLQVNTRLHYPRRLGPGTAA